MSFLTIPEPEGLFTSVKTGRVTEEGHSSVDEDDDDDTQNVHLIPRSSPIPRKRGQSIYDEDAEYLRIRLGLVLPARRVSFADTTGGDLVYVKEFGAFDSDEEDATYEAEEAKYRRPDRHPIYRVRPEFDMPTPSTLTHAVHTNKIEVEMVSAVEDDPLTFRGVIRVLNISFNKAVYIRSTMDSWGTYYDYPAEYVQGSHDGETDKFSFRLSFAPPYVTHGSRIEFVVRFETPDGDYWANNNGRNYVVTLLLSYEEELAQASRYDMQDIKGILKPGKIYSMEDDFYDDPDLEEGEPECSVTGYVRPIPICPVIIQPEIDVEVTLYGHEDILKSCIQFIVPLLKSAHSVQVC
ncbi:protein phosphatase 1 regulatory subunit 3A isoform X1 [Osmerus mordax]|uniref:protein phosphatase 1 regulatory subunit 3A isoform X1 n=1 Tax=Osmerus mordax TaxID=8014 RepID=UPI00350F27C1